MINAEVPSGGLMSDIINPSFLALNVQRATRWHGEGIASWSLNDWLGATTGELGEAANVIKKLRRVEDGLVSQDARTETQLYEDLALELADTATYLFLLAERAGIDLSEAIGRKFNIVSERFGFPERWTF